MTKRILAIVLALAMVFGAGSAMAFMSNGTGSYDITLDNTCTIDTTMASMSFGTWSLNYGILTSAAGAVGVYCSGGLPYILGADGGQYPNQSLVNSNLPTMANGAGQYVAYNLYDPGLGVLGDANLTSVDITYSPVNFNPTGANGWSGIGSGGWVYYGLTADVFINDPAQVAGYYSDIITFTVVW